MGHFPCFTRSADLGQHRLRIAGHRAPPSARRSKTASKAWVKSKRTINHPMATLISSPKNPSTNAALARTSGSSGATRSARRARPIPSRRLVSRVVPSRLRRDVQVAAAWADQQPVVSVDTKKTYAAGSGINGTHAFASPWPSVAYSERTISTARGDICRASKPTAPASGTLSCSINST